MKLSTLKKKYPNTFHKFYTSRFCENYYLRITNVPILETDVRNHWREITDFMDKQGIIISVWYTYRDFSIAVDIEGETIYEKNKPRKQAETKAIEKAFQILEERSEG